MEWVIPVIVIAAVVGAVILAVGRGALRSNRTSDSGGAVFGSGHHGDGRDGGSHDGGSHGGDGGGGDGGSGGD